MLGRGERLTTSDMVAVGGCWWLLGVRVSCGSRDTDEECTASLWRVYISLHRPLRRRRKRNLGVPTRTYVVTARFTLLGGTPRQPSLLVSDLPKKVSLPVTLQGGGSTMTQLVSFGVIRRLIYDVGKSHALRESGSFCRGDWGWARLSAVRPSGRPRACSSGEGGDWSGS